jgi:hypothetical protein
MRALLVTVLILCCTAAPAADTATPQDVTRALVEFLKKSGAVIQCGPVTIRLAPDGNLTADGLPHGNHPIGMKGGEIYIGDYLCKPACNTPAQQRC